MTPPLRVCAVSFLNAWPLYRPLLERPPAGEDGEPLFTVQEALPAECARRLAADACDAAISWSESFGLPEGLCGATSVQEVTFVATDSCGNSARSTANFVIDDTAAPTVNTAPPSSAFVPRIFPPKLCTRP